MRAAQRILVLIAAVVSLVLVLPRELAPPNNPRIVTDHVGRQVPVPPRIGKVYATTESGSMLVYALDPNLLAGWNTDLSPTWQFVLGEKAQSLPVLGTWNQVYKTANLDRIAALQPDIVLHVAVPDLPTLELVDQVETELGIPTVVVDGSLEAIPQALRFVGELLGPQVRADILALYAENILTSLSSLRQVLPANARAYVVGDTAKTDLADCLGTAGIIRTDTGRNRPDMVLIIPDSIRDLRRELEKDGPADIAPLLADGKAYELPTVPTNWLTPGSLFRLLGIEWLASKAYPTLYPVDLVSRFEEFMEVFYEVKLPEKVAEITLGGT